MIVDINGVPHYMWRGKLYPGGVTPPPDPSDGAPRVIANRIDGGVIICLIPIGCHLPQPHHHRPRYRLRCCGR